MMGCGCWNESMDNRKQKKTCDKKGYRKKKVNKVKDET